MEEKSQLSKKSDVALREEEVLKFWKENKIFEKTLSGDSPKGEYVFYDGPPFATGLPHYGHILASTIKDVIPRYKTMQGFHVPRRWGWDCHGLPIENIVEKELGFKHKKEIKEFGIDKFNEKCRDAVLAYAHEWEKVIPRIGRFVDMDNPYRTMDKDFMESVWWVFKQLWDKGLVYEDYRSMHICPRCETTLSQQEVSEGYKDVKDIAVTVKFKLKPGQKFANGKYETKDSAYILAWTTTPWTLPGNVALAVGEEIKYVALRIKDIPELLIVAQERVSKVFEGKEIEIVHDDLMGTDLLGLEYEPLFTYYAKDENLKNRENGWKVYAADFITAEDGTGIAHEAPAFGADDWELLKKVGLPFVQHVNLDGTMKVEVTDFAGMEVKPKSDDDKVRLGTDIAVLKYLQDHNLFFAKENITHSYPHCWRCDTPLLNYATSSWFVSVLKIKENLLKNAESVHWTPDHIKAGRFGKWLEGARDWSISRQRFWASVIPLWVCKSCKKQKVFGSAQELEEASGKKIDDLHKHIVDQVTVACECGGTMYRIPDVLDTWFDSGSMPYGEWHYPFENKKTFEEAFPADFIAEGVDQTRAWFYYLHILGTALFDSHAFKYVVVNGIALAEDGKKMSKKLQNYPDPMKIVDTYSADALRLYMLSSPIVQAENLNFSEKGVDELHKKVIQKLQNVVSFYELYSTDLSKPTSFKGNILDSWITNRLLELRNTVTESLEKYELDKASRPIVDFVDDFSTWYIRRSRERFKSEDKNTSEAAIRCTAFVLVELSKLMAPITPFLAEDIYKKVRLMDHNGGYESVHLASWPEYKSSDIFNDSELIKNMQISRDLVSKALELRQKAGIKVRQPLAYLSIPQQLSQEFLDIIADEVNVKKIEVRDKFELDTNITPELKQEGIARDIIRAIQDARKEAGLQPKDFVVLHISVDDSTKEVIENMKEIITKPTGVKEIIYSQNTDLNSGELWRIQSLVREE